MPENKTKKTTKSVADFIQAIPDEVKRNDSQVLVKLIKSETGFPPKMWGPSIIGFGSYHYVYESGREGDMPLVGFSPRKEAIVFYLSIDTASRDSLLKKLGKHTTGKGCVYVKKLDDIDLGSLMKLIVGTVKQRKRSSTS